MKDAKNAGSAETSDRKRRSDELKKRLGLGTRVVVPVAAGALSGAAVGAGAGAISGPSGALAGALIGSAIGAAASIAIKASAAEDYEVSPDAWPDDD
ncbi:MAG: hypothetical protein ABIP39_16830 [Polyangiaceae bacterium]